MKMEKEKKATKNRNTVRAEKLSPEQDQHFDLTGPIADIIALQHNSGNQAISDLLQPNSGALAQADKDVITSRTPNDDLLQKTPAPRSKIAELLDLPWSYGNYSLFEINSSGIQFLVGIDATDEKTIREIIPVLAKQIADDNKLINDASYQVKTCIISPTTTRFALYNDALVLMLHPPEADPGTVSHEMGHALFFYLAARSATKSEDASKAKNFRLQVAYIYRQLGNTKDITVVGAEGKEKTMKAGYWIVDPSQWKPGGRFEHPQENPDEFFASAKEAYQMDRAALVERIDKFSEQDSRVREPAKELVSLLDAFLATGKLPQKGLPKERKGLAEQALEKEQKVSKVEDTLSGRPVLEWLLNPDKRPK